MWDAALPLAAAASGVAWARLGAARGGERAGFAVKAFLGGAAAFGFALLAYDAFARAGVDVRWDRMVRGDTAAFLLAAAVGLVEEGAKLTGILLVVDRGVRTRTAVAAMMGVAAGFASFETLHVWNGAWSAVAVVRAALAPVAHALLAAPVALAVAPALRSRRPAMLVLPLLASAALHGAGDLSLALSGVGYTGYALALAAPALMLFARARRRRRAASAPVPSWK